MRHNTDCDIDAEDPVTPAPTETPTPSPAVGVVVVIDCDVVMAGWQSDCDVPLGTSSVAVDVTLFNNTASAIQLGTFNFDLVQLDDSRLIAPSNTNQLDGNPDFLADVTELEHWACGPPNPDSDINPQPTDAGQKSFLSCFNYAASGPLLASGSTLTLARLVYDVPPGALQGSVPLTLARVAVSNETFTEVHSCNPNITKPGQCYGASLNFVDAPTSMPTPTPTTTNTSTPAPEGPHIEKQPDGNATNIGSGPSANLWICEQGPCARPGEGALRVVEHASGVQDGLGAYEFTVEYDNFVFQSVNPCDLVFGPGGAGAARGPVDELDASMVNADCSPDPGGANDGTCALSLLLENLVHFGCVTSGQAAGPTGDFDLASLLLVPHPDLNNDMLHGNNNGVITVIKDNGCELVDTLGHPVSGSVNGGLTPVCGDLAVTVRILEGDLDLDCDVDVTDVQLIASKYGAFFGSLLYSKWYDLEPQFHDLDIDIKDVQKVFGRDGSTCQDPIPAQPPHGPFVPFGPTVTPTWTPTDTPTATPSWTPAPSATATPSWTPAPSATATPLPCAGGIAARWTAGNGHCYRRFNNQLGFHAAKADCEARGSHLVTIADSAEQAFVYDNVGASAYIGLTDEATEGTWVWVTGEPTGYMNWLPGEPNNVLNEDAAALTVALGGGRWNDVQIDYPLAYICEGP